MMQVLKNTKEDFKVRKMIVICVVTSLIVIPLISASAMLNHPINKGTTINGVQSLQGTSNGIVSNFNNESIENLISYLNENEWGAKYFSVVAIAQTANKILISTSKAFMAIGGVSGTDRVLTLAKFRETLRKKEIKLKNTVDAFIILKDFSEMKSPFKFTV